MLQKAGRGIRNMKKCPRGLWMTPNHNQLAKNGNGIKHEMLRKNLTYPSKQQQNMILLHINNIFEKIIMLNFVIFTIYIIRQIL